MPRAGTWERRPRYAAPDIVSVEEVVDFQPALVPTMQALPHQLGSGTTSLQLLTELVEDPGSVLFVARRDGVVVGTATVGSFRTAAGLHCRIEDVVVVRSPPPEPELSSR